jgi:hypothetical protein
MTVDKVKAEVQRIAGLVDDDEEAHSAEDKLHHDVLIAIASGKTANPQGIALEAIQTKEIRFARWYA